MTYREFLLEFAPARDDVGFVAAALGSCFTVGLLIAIPLCFGYGNFDPLLTLLAITASTLLIVSTVFFVGTFIYWAIAKR